MPRSAAIAGPVTAGIQNVEPQPMSYVRESAATMWAVGVAKDRLVIVRADPAEGGASGGLSG